MKILNFPRRDISHGFTTVELLVVTAIIGLLAALLFPVFGIVRERSRQSVCASNLRQLYMAYAQYAQSYNGNFPPYSNNIEQCVSPSTMGDTKQYRFPEHGDELVNALLPFTKSKAIWFCPDDALANTNSREGFLDRRFSSYHTIWRLSLKTVTAYWPLPFDNPTGNFLHPDGGNNEFILLSDEAWKETISFNVTPSGHVTRNYTARLFSHNDRWNCLYFDGHIKSQPETYFDGFNQCMPGGNRPVVNLP